MHHGPGHGCVYTICRPVSENLRLLHIVVELIRQYQRKQCSAYSVALPSIEHPLMKCHRRQARVKRGWFTANSKHPTAGQLLLLPVARASGSSIKSFHFKLADRYKYLGDWEGLRVSTIFSESELTAIQLFPLDCQPPSNRQNERKGNHLVPSTH